MRIIYQRVAGLDVHKKTVVATRMWVDEEDRVQWETKTFGTMTKELLSLSDWLSERGCIQVATESTGEYWKPVYNVLEEQFDVWVVNAKHIKHVPGRKTDVKDAEWLAEVMLHGMVKKSFVPDKPQRAVRDLTRYRAKMVEERTRIVNRVQKVLEGANIKLSSVASDVMGVSGRAMLAAICEGQATPKTMAELAKGRLRNKIPLLEDALTSLVESHHRFLLAKQLAHIDFLDEQIADISAEIARLFEEMSDPPHDSDTDEQQHPEEEGGAAPTWTAAVELMDTIPGINETSARSILAEIGVDMRQFPTANHLTAWGGLAPGNRQSGGKRYKARTRKGNRSLTSIMVQAAWSAVRTKGTFYKARYSRLVVRRGKKRAIVAIARSMLVSIWHILTSQQPYQELGGDFFDKRKTESQITYHTHKLEKITGGSVKIILEPSTA